MQWPSADSWQFEYKYLLQTNNVAVWEEGPNRRFVVEQPITGVCVSDHWRAPGRPVTPQRSLIKDFALSRTGVVVCFRVECAAIERKDFEVRLSGNLRALGAWQPSGSLLLHACPAAPKSSWYQACIAVEYCDFPLE